MDTNLLLAYLGIGFAVAMTGIGSSIGLTMCGKAVVGAMKKDPSQLGRYIGLSALPSSQGLYGFVAFFLALPHIQPEMSALAAAAIFGSGLALGAVGFYSAIRQAMVCAAGVEGCANGHDVFVSSMVMAVFPELYAILGLLVAILTYNAIPA